MHCRFRFRGCLSAAKVLCGIRDVVASKVRAPSPPPPPLNRNRINAWARQVSYARAIAAQIDARRERSVSRFSLTSSFFLPPSLPPPPLFLKRAKKRSRGRVEIPPVKPRCLDETRLGVKFTVHVRQRRRGRFIARRRVARYIDDIAVNGRAIDARCFSFSLRLCRKAISAV